MRGRLFEKYRQRGFAAQDFSIAPGRLDPPCGLFRAAPAMKQILATVATLACTCALSFGAASKPQPPKAPNGAPVVRVSSTNQSYDYAQPWVKKSPFSRRGTGAVLGGQRVLVTAEMVANHNFVELEKPRTGERTPASVEVVDYDCNLALLKPHDPEFLKELGAFELASGADIGDASQILQVESNGEIARTPAMLTTITVAPYPLESASLLTFRLSAPLQSRDSSFVLPAERDGRLLGLLMRYDARTQTADLIPYAIIKLFLDRAKESPTVGFPRAGVSFASTRDPQLRKFLGLERAGGVFVTEVLAGSPAEQAGLQRGDVILEVAGWTVDPDGLYDDPDFGKILFSHLFSSSPAGSPVPVTLFRGGKSIDTEILPEAPNEEDAISPNQLFDRAPNYLVVGGLVFQELSRSFLREWGGNWRKNAPQRLVYLDAFQSELPPDRGKIVFLSSILPSDDTLGYEGLESLVVTRANGKEIQSLTDLQAALNEPMGKFHKIEFEEDPGVIFLNAEQVEANRDRLARDYGIPAMQKLPDQHTSP